MSMGNTARHLPYTWDDYRSWGDDSRWEILDGVPHAMSPAPSVRHQMILLALARRLGQHFDARPCEVLVSPVDVRLSDLDVVQPDLSVVCDPKQNRGTHVEGPPSLVIEILSPSTAQRDRGSKLDLYARCGVPEVWLVTPFPQSVEVFRLDGATYRRQAAYTQDDTLASPGFPDLKVDLAPVFDFPLEPGEEPPVIREPPPRYRAAAADAGG